MNTPTQKIVVLVNSLFGISVLLMAAFVILDLTQTVLSGGKKFWTSKDFWLLIGFAASLAGLICAVCFKTINAVLSSANQAQLPLLLLNGAMLTLGLLFGMDVFFGSQTEWQELLPLIAAAVALMNLIFLIATPGQLNNG